MTFLSGEIPDFKVMQNNIQQTDFLSGNTSCYSNKHAEFESWKLYRTGTLPSSRVDLWLLFRILDIWINFHLDEFPKICWIKHQFKSVCSLKFGVEKLTDIKCLLFLSFAVTRCSNHWGGDDFLTYWCPH